MLANYQAGLFALRNLFIGSRVNNYEEFKSAAREVLARYEGIAAIEWVPYVTEAGRAAFEAERTQEFGRPFQITKRHPDRSFSRADPFKLPNRARARVFCVPIPNRCISR